ERIAVSVRLGMGDRIEPGQPALHDPPLVRLERGEGDERPIEPDRGRCHRLLRSTVRAIEPRVPTERAVAASARTAAGAIRARRTRRRGPRRMPRPTLLP